MTQLDADNFNRANGGIGTDWTNLIVGTGAFAIASNQVSHSGFGGARFTRTAAPNNGYSEIIVRAVASSADSGVGPMYRCSTSGDDAYFAQGGADTRLYRISAGVFQQLGSTVGGVSIGDALRIVCNGTTISVLKNLISIISVTDSTLTTGQAGIWGTFDSPTAGLLDDFSFGDLTAPSIILTQIDRHFPRGMLRGYRGRR